jgi:multidrug efflux system outer membrane protein
MPGGRRSHPAESSLAQTQRDQLLAVVNLYKALGGGWATP